MAFLVSPGVQVKEVDLTNVVPAVATSIGAIAGAFEKGPVSSVTTITSEEDLIKNFGKPNSTRSTLNYNKRKFTLYHVYITCMYVSAYCRGDCEFFWKRLPYGY